MESKVKNNISLLLYVADLVSSSRIELNEHLILSGSHLMFINVKDFLSEFIENPILAKKRATFHLKKRTCSFGKLS